MTGKIKRLHEKGFGFIAIEGREKDLFFHAKNVIGAPFSSLNDGDEVEFDGIEPTPKGEQAYGVRLANL